MKALFNTQSSLHITAIATTTGIIYNTNQLEMINKFILKYGNLKLDIESLDNETLDEDDSNR